MTTNHEALAPAVRVAVVTGGSRGTASKGAIESITLILARELRGRDITVNTVAPGPTATELFLDGKTTVRRRGVTEPDATSSEPPTR